MALSSENLSSILSFVCSQEGISSFRPIEPANRALGQIPLAPDDIITLLCRAIGVPPRSKPWNMAARFVFTFRQRIIMTLP
jgi:hypothetical protein